MAIVLPSNSEIQNQKVSKQEFKEFIARIDLSKLEADQLRTILEQLKHLEQLEEEAELTEAKTNFLTFFRMINPTFVIQEEGHHGKIAKIFENLVDGNLKRVNISTPPRYTKSEMTSIALPAWVLGKNPKWKIIQASSTDVLATDFGRKVKNLIASDVYQRIFPGVTLSKDSKASGKFATNHGGEYYAVGVGGAIAGRGADVFICLSPNEPVYGSIKTHAIGDIVTSGKYPLVITQNKIGLPCLRRVTALFKNKTYFLTTIKTRSKSMECTPNHPVWVERKGFISADQVQTGDVLISLRFPSIARIAAILSFLTKNLTRGVIESFARLSAITSIGLKKQIKKLARFVIGFTA